MFGIRPLAVSSVHIKRVDLVFRGEELQTDPYLAHVVSALSLLGSVICRNNSGKDEGG